VKRNKDNINKYKILCTSPNSTNLINLCSANGIILSNIQKTSKGMTFELSSKSYAQFKKLNTKGYILSVVRSGGMRVVLNNILYRIGLIIGLIICMLSMFFLNNRLLQIHISGLSAISKEEVLFELKNLGVNTLTYMDLDTKKIEEELANKFDFSLVSIITKGNSLIISVKESLPSLEDSYVPITADFNMVINSINVYSGTCMVNAGDIVYKGDVLVEPYVKSGDDVVYVTPCAEIKSSIYTSSSYTFYSIENKLQRTGKVQLISVSMFLGKWKMYNKDIQTKFENFETEQSSELISNYFLPIRTDKVFAYELENVTFERDFETEKEDIINKLNSEAYSKVPNGVQVDAEDVTITPINDGYIINVYLTSKLTQVYKYRG